MFERSYSEREIEALRWRGEGGDPWWATARGRLEALLAETAATAAQQPAPGYTGAGQTVIVIDTGMARGHDHGATTLSHDFAGRNDPNAASRDPHGAWVA